MIGLVLSLACGQACAGQPHDRSFTGKMWPSTDASAASGTIRVFLPDGMLLMDWCGETYRLARWTSINDTRIAWEEDGREDRTLSTGAGPLRLR